jgi:hypothetical protein
MRQQSLGRPRIFGGNQRRLSQDTQRAQRDILQIAYRRRYDIQPADFALLMIKALSIA